MFPTLVSHVSDDCWIRVLSDWDSRRGMAHYLRVSDIEEVMEAQPMDGREPSCLIVRRSTQVVFHAQGTAESIVKLIARE